MIKFFIKQLLYWLDQGLNVFLLGYADELLSARCYRLKDKYLHFFVLMLIVDAIFYVIERDHCKNAFINEKNRKYLPKEYRNEPLGTESGN